MYQECTKNVTRMYKGLPLTKNPLLEDALASCPSDKESNRSGLSSMRKPLTLSSLYY